MKTTTRFNNAVNKLYKAYLDGTLNQLDRCACAVGNMCDNNPEWNYVLYFERKTKTVTEGLRLIKETGYSVIEVSNIETLFMYGARVGEGIGDEEINLNVTEATTDEVTLKALLLVIDYLAELDGIEVPKIKELFSTKQLTELCTN